MKKKMQIQKFEINLQEMVYNYPTKSKHGFTDGEIELLLSWFPTIHKNKFEDAMMGNTGILEEGKFINYHCDVYQALVCGLENRNLKLEEWD